MKEFSVLFFIFLQQNAGGGGSSLVTWDMLGESGDAGIINMEDDDDDENLSDTDRTTTSTLTSTSANNMVGSFFTGFTVGSNRYASIATL
jgi:hypothetical protein